MLNGYVSSRIRPTQWSLNTGRSRPMRVLHRIYNFMSSMKTGLLLLLLIGLASAIGSSALPGTFFHTPVFRFLLILLLLNLVLCTVNRVKQTARVLLNRPGSKVWYRSLGILLLHLGIVLILAGGAVFAAYGQNERIQLMAGEQVDLSKVLDIKDPFTLRLDEFRIEFNEDGSPSQYRSEVTILEQGQSVDQRVISVNHPLNYRGVKAYQFSFGYTVTAEYDGENGEKLCANFLEGTWLKPAGTGRTVKIYKYIPDFNPAYGMKTATLRPDNPHVIFSVYEDDKFLGVGKARLNEPTRIDENVDISFTGVEAYTILEVKYDPGLPLVMTGGVILMLGVCMSVLAAPVRKKPAETQPQP